MKHIFYFKDGTRTEYSEPSSSDIIVATKEYPVLGAQMGMFNVKFSDERSLYIPFDSVKYVVTLPAEDDEEPTTGEES